MTLTWLVYQAYGDGGFNTSMSVRGGPDRTTFAVEGIASGPATPAQLRLMLQTLLQERFALKIRTEIQESTTNAVLALTVDRSDGTLGPKVKKWDGTCPPVMPALYFPAPRRSIQAGLPRRGVARSTRSVAVESGQLPAATDVVSGFSRIPSDRRSEQATPRRRQRPAQ